MQIGGGRRCPGNSIISNLALFATPYPLSFQILAHSLALFCRRENDNYLVFNQLCTLHPKKRTAGNQKIRLSFSFLVPLYPPKRNPRSISPPTHHPLTLPPPPNPPPP